MSKWKYWIVLKWLIFFVVIAVCLIAVTFFLTNNFPILIDKIRSFPQVSNNVEVRQIWEQALDSSRGRNFEDATRYAEQALTKNLSSLDRWEAQTLFALNLFLTGEEKKQIDAVRLLKDVYTGLVQDAEAPQRFKAYTINKLIDLYYTGRPPRVFKEIFSEGPFVHLAQGGDEKLMMRKLAEFSNSIFPTSFAVLRETIWYSGELLDNKKLTQSDRMLYREKIKSSLKEADLIFNNENNSYTYSAPYTRAAGHNHWRAFNLGVIALDERDKRKDFEEAFQTVLSFRGQDTQGEERSIVTTLPYTYFYYAAFLYDIFGQSRINDIHDNLQKLVTIINDDSELHRGIFLAFMKIERDKDLSKRDHNYRWFTELADVSPVFKEFLVSQGWILP